MKKNKNVQGTCLNNWNRQIYLLFLPCVLFSLFLSWNTKNRIVDSLLKLNTFHPFCCFPKRLSDRSTHCIIFFFKHLCRLLFVINCVGTVVFLFDRFIIIVYIDVFMYKRWANWVSLSCTVSYKWVTVMDGVKFEFNDIISLYKKKRFWTKTVRQLILLSNIYWWSYCK